MPKMDGFHLTPVARAVGAVLAAILLPRFAWSLAGEVYDALSDFGNPENYAIRRLFDG